jgi:hypothetical protein
MKKTKRQMQTIRNYEKNHFSPPKCSNHRQILKKQCPKQTSKVLKKRQNRPQKHGQTSPFSIKKSVFIKKGRYFCYVLLSHDLYKILQKFFFYARRFLDTCFPFRRLKWRSKKTIYDDPKMV